MGGMGMAAGVGGGALTSSIPLGPLPGPDLPRQVCSEERFLRTRSTTITTTTVMEGGTTMEEGATLAEGMTEVGANDSEGKRRSPHRELSAP